MLGSSDGLHTLPNASLMCLRCLPAYPRTGCPSHFMLTMLLHTSTLCTAEGIHGGALLGIRSADFIAFYDWGTGKVRIGGRGA